MDSPEGLVSKNLITAAIKLPNTVLCRFCEARIVAHTKTEILKCKKIMIDTIKPPYTPMYWATVRLPITKSKLVSAT